MSISCLFISVFPFSKLQVDIFAQLQNASEAFRTYIRDGLAQVCNTSISSLWLEEPHIKLPTNIDFIADGEEYCCWKDAF